MSEVVRDASAFIMGMTMEWNLADHGDRIEKYSSRNILPLFPEYEVVWRNFIVPMTFRPKTIVSERLHINLRSGPKDELKSFASAHYGVYFHLAVASNQLTDLKKAESLFVFYSSLYAALADGIVLIISESSRLDKKLPADITGRLEYWKDAGLKKKYDDLVKDIGKYRHLLVHYPILVMVDGKVPIPDKLPDDRKGRIASEYWNLSLMVGLILDPDKVKADYTDSLALAKSHYDICLSVINGIWIHLHGDLKGISGITEMMAAFNDNDLRYLESHGIKGLVGVQGDTSIDANRCRPTSMRTDSGTGLSSSYSGE